MNDDPQRREQSREPKSVLPYAARRPRQPYLAMTPLGLQMAAGIVAWLLGVGGVWMAAERSANMPGVNPIEIALWVVGLMLVCLGGVAIFLRVRYDWRGFIPGLLIGLILTCLIPIGIVSVICGWWK